MGDRTTRGGTTPPLRLDLLGVRCPVNWARAKSALEQLPRGRRLQLVTDDPRALADIPVAAEAEGHVIVEAVRRGDIVTILIEC
jgi:TusA-related sulfurtransferase